MSLGYGVGDFIAVLGLLNTVRKQFIDAPDQFTAISNEGVPAVPGSEDVCSSYN